MKSYELFLHWKQGDDFSRKLRNADSTEEALRNWAEEFESHAEHCRKLADLFDGKEIGASADTHHISFRGNEEVLKKATEKGLLREIEHEE